MLPTSRVLRGGDGDVFRCRTSILEPFLVKLVAEWDGGCRNGAELWRRLRAMGFRGGVRVVAEWATRRRTEEVGRPLSRTAPLARQLSRLLTTRRDHLSEAGSITVASIESGVPALGVVRDLMDRFHRMLRASDADALTPWLADTGDSLLASGTGVQVHGVHEGAVDVEDGGSGHQVILTVGRRPTSAEPHGPPDGDC